VRFHNNNIIAFRSLLEMRTGFHKIYSLRAEE
jgi:hypothetical protein